MFTEMYCNIYRRRAAPVSGGFSAEARLIHAGTCRALDQPVTPPLVPASIFVSTGEPRPARSYGREGNPGWEALEEALGGMEDAEAVAFASGQAASMALMLALARGPGPHRAPLGRVLRDAGSSRAGCARTGPRRSWPITQDLAAVERELNAAPSVLWAETPTNPLLRVSRPESARPSSRLRRGAPMIVDNTVATGLLQRPLDLGATASLYS